MTDEGANQISQINKVTMCPSMHIFIIEAEILQEELFTMSFWPNMVLHKTCYWIILGYWLSPSLVRFGNQPGVIDVYLIYTV